MSDSICTICGGSKSSHFDGDGKAITIHAYTEREGDLQTPEQKARAEQQNAPRMTIPPAALGGGNIQTGRLIEVLLEKGILTTEEALYIGLMAPRPAKKSFADPAEVTS